METATTIPAPSAMAATTNPATPTPPSIPPTTTNTMSGTTALPSDTPAVASPSPAAAAVAMATGPDMARSQSRQSAQSPVAEVSEQPAYSTPPEKIQVLSPEQLTALLPPFLRQTKSEIMAKFGDLEWQERNRLLKGQTETDPQSEWARLTGEEVTRRNRYANVDPFTSNRVRLKVPEGQNDYINASPITLRSARTGKRKDYIATQGPKNTIRSHIWHMIWHETSDPAVIVMLTQTHESGKEKCFPYFPESMDDPTTQVNEHDEFGDGFSGTVTLKSVNEDAKTHSTIRELEFAGTPGVMGPSVSSGTEVEGNGASNDDESNKNHRTVWHLLFAGWPDFFVPESEDRAALLALIELSKQLSGDGDRERDHRRDNNNIHSSETESRNPRIIHCSAGVGRSGTFIALDYLLSEVEDGAFDPVNVDASAVNAVNYSNNNMNSSSPSNHTRDMGNHKDDDDDGKGDDDGENRPPKYLNFNNNSNNNNNNNNNNTEPSDSDDPIADTVDRLRRQRMMMVNMESQFNFLYVVLREAMLRRLERLMSKKGGVGARNGKEL